MRDIAVDSVLAWVADQYALQPPLASELIRAYTNDVFLVQTARGRCVLKVYGSGWRTETEILYEVQLLDHLAAKGVLVARALPGKDRRPVQSFPTSTRRRVASSSDSCTNFAERCMREPLAGLIGGRATVI